MTTRGYVTLIDKQKNILSACYLSSDAYPSYYGLEVLDALQQGQLSAYIDRMLTKYPADKDMVENIKRSWYIKRKETKNDYFVDYVYEFDCAAEKLNMYYFGEKKLTIPVGDIPFYHQLFDLDDALVIPIRFDPVSCMLKKDFYTELRRLLQNGATIEDLQKRSREPILYLEYGRVKGYGWHKDDFTKYIRDTVSGNRLTVHASHYGSKQYTLYVQTPFYRSPIVTRPLNTPGAVEKELARLIHDRPEDIRGTMQLLSRIDAYKQQMSAAFQDASVPYNDRASHAEKLLDEMVICLQKSSREYKLLGCPEESFTRQLREVYYRRAEKARKAAEHDKPLLEDTIASAEDQQMDQDAHTQETPQQEIIPER